LGCKGPCTTKELLDIATNFASGEEAVGAIFHNTKGKGSGKRTPTRAVLATTPRRRRRRLSNHARPFCGYHRAQEPPSPSEGGMGVFDEMLEKPCPYHRGPAKHTLKECGMMKCYISEGAQGKGNPNKRPKEDKGDSKEKDDDFPVNNCFMIFGGPAAYDSRR
jgi:hypothetical protein